MVLMESHARRHRWLEEVRKMRNYIWDSELNLLRREAFTYVDGEAAERRIYDAVCQAADRSTFSIELARAITDWPSEYHLSRRRHCLVRPLAIKPGDRVLELSCGCGAITRFLGELDAEVTAVEPNFQRASIASERCRDLQNVKIVLDEPLDLQTEERFDWVLLIGVLEYAPILSNLADPINYCLSVAAQFLAPKGKLVVAIGNKLGLKYFNGCAEDLTGVAFYGIQGLYGQHTPRTFGRRELEGHLAAVGLGHTKFYFPFPDHKLPKVIISDQAWSEPTFRSADLLASCHARDYTGSNYRNFDDTLVFAQAASNGLLADLSNSFLVAAGASRDIFETDFDLAVAYAVDRIPEFGTQTRFVRAGTTIEVVKEALRPELARRATLKGSLILENSLGRSDYVSGELLFWRVLKARCRGGSLQEVVSALKPWLEVVLQHAVSRDGSKRLSQYVISGSCLDLTPFTLKEKDSNIVPIDEEWKINGFIPLGWLITRSLLHSLGIGVPVYNSLVSIKDVIGELCSLCDMEFVESDVQEWLEWEDELQALVGGRQEKRYVPTQTSSGLISLRGALAESENRIAALDRLVNLRQEAVLERDGKVAELTRAIEERDARIAQSMESLHERDAKLEHLQHALYKRDEQISACRQTIALIFASTSWRITAPLRSVSRMVRAMRPRLRIGCRC
jgi:SAM-dependent methyltransferase